MAAWEEAPIVERPAQPPRPVNRTSPAAQALAGSAPTQPAQPAPRAPQAAAQAAQPAWMSAPIVEQAPPAAPRQVGFTESAGRTAASAATPVVRTLGLSVAGVLEQMRGVADIADAMAPIFGLKPSAKQNLQAAQGAVFQATDERTASMREMYDPKAGEEMDLAGQIVGGIASMPIEVVGGMGLQRGVERAADVVQRGGSLPQAAVAGGATGAANVAANLLPIKLGGAAGRAVERGLGGGRAAAVGTGAATGAGLGIGGDLAVNAASNAALPAGEEFKSLEQEASPAVSGGLGAALGALGGALGAPQVRAPRKAAAKAEQKSAKEETRDLARKAEEFGIPLRPDQLSDNRIVRAIGEALEKVPFGGSRAEARQTAFNRAVMDQMGADPKAERLTPDVFDEAMSRSGGTIGEISAKSAIPLDSKLDSALTERVRQSEKFGTSDVAKIVGNYVEEVRSKVADGVLPGEAFKNINSQLGKQIRGADGELKQSLSELQDTLHDALERNISGEDLAALKDARRKYAIGKTVEPLVAKSTIGDVSPAGLMGRVTADKAGKARMARGKGGEMGDLARIGQRFLKEPPSSGTAERLGAYGTIGGLGTGVLLAPGAAAAGAATIGAANVYNRAGPKLTKLLLKKRGDEPVAKQDAPAPVPREETPALPAVARDPRLAEIDRLRADASPEVSKVLDERTKVVEVELKAAERKAAREADADTLDATAAKTEDADLRTALRERANSLRERVPAGEANELEAPTGRAPEMKPLPTGKATDVPRETVTGQPPDLRPIPVGKAAELAADPLAGRAPDLPTIPVGKVVEGRKPMPAGEAAEIDMDEWRAAHGFGTLDADRAVAVEAAMDVDEAAVKAATVQHAKSPRAYDRAIASILERKEPPNESDAGQTASSGPGPAGPQASGARIEDGGRGDRPGEGLSQEGGADAAVAQEVDAGAHQAATSPNNDLPEPTQAQKDAGNYTKGHVRVAGLDISIENPEGSIRKGVDQDGTPWETTLQAHYGYVRGTEAADGDKLDVFVKPGTAADFSGPVFVVDQIDPKTGKFDEHKAVIGAADEAEARAIYQANYPADWKGLRAITALPVAAFKAWAATKAARKPLAEMP